MSASFVSTFVMNIVGLLIAVFKMSSPTHDPLIDWMILAAVFANIIFFYAFGAVSENNAQHRAFLKPRRDVEWPLRVLSNVILLCLPLTLDDGGLGWFWITLLAFYLSLIIWDWTVFGHRPKNAGDPPNPLVFDALGLVCCGLIGLGITMILISKAPSDFAWLPALMIHNLSDPIQQGRA